MKISVNRLLEVWGRIKYLELLISVLGTRRGWLIALNDSLMIMNTI